MGILSEDAASQILATTILVCINNPYFN